MSFINKILRLNAVRTAFVVSRLPTSRTATTFSPFVPNWTTSNHFGGHRGFLTSSSSLTSASASSREEVTVTFIRASGERLEAKGKVGDNLLDIIVDNDIDLDGYGACEGTLACSTCHLIFKPEDYAKLGETPTDEELDMLDLAYGLTDTSRLGCQVCMTKELNGLEVNVPEGIHDQRDA